jgi:predicted GNAT family N-acyltransferase
VEEPVVPAPEQQQPDIKVIPVKNQGDFAAALAIREIVFIEEQSVPVELERDDEDPTAFHVIGFHRGHAIATGRLLELPTPPPGETGRWAQIGRMAVLAAHRKQGVGGGVLRALEAEARRRGIGGAMVHSQVHAKGFYERQGYEVVGPVFVEAGMPHVEMRKRFE